MSISMHHLRHKKQEKNPLPPSLGVRGDIMIPNAVYNEVVLQGASRPGARDVMGAAWIIKVPVKNQLTVKTLETDLDRDDGTPL
jgi:hypothetical protein